MGNREFVIEIDVDGVLIDDIGHAFDMRMIRGGTTMSNAFRESVYNLVKLARGNAAAKELDVSIGLLPDAVTYVRDQMGKPNRRIRFRTKNPFSNLETIIGMLEISGVRNPDVRRYNPREEKPDLRVQDDTQETWKSTWERVDTIHRGGTHSGFLGRISSRVNERVHFVSNLGDGTASRITDEVFSRNASAGRSLSRA
jgi:hypothetical protein